MLMLSALYLIIALFLGELICRRFIQFESLPHRLAAHFLIGILASTWLTYVAALSFYWTANPLLYGNIVFFIVAGTSLYLGHSDGIKLDAFRPSRSDDKWTYLFAAAVFVFSSWLMFGTFGMNADNLKIVGFLMNDFGPNLSLVQSFAVGHNFPTEYPHFIGEPIRYHFLFWFQAGNLEFLGLNIAWALNLISALTMAAMLLMIDAFGRIVFTSKAAGRIAAVLFFFHGTLSSLPFLRSKNSVGEMFSSIVRATEWLNSIYTYTGEQWGIWSMGTYLAQRHLPAAIGIFLIVLIFLINKIREKEAEVRASLELAKSVDHESIEEAARPSHLSSSHEIVPLPAVTETVVPTAVPTVFLALVPYVIAGLILGLLPMWNGAIYVSGFAIIGSMLIFFRNRIETFCLLAVSASFAVPQLLFLRSGGSRGITELFRWGYVVEPATIWNVAEYFSFTFGVKLILALIAAILLTALHRKLFLAVSTLVVLTFCTQLSTDIMNNHKFMNVWLILINGYAAYTLVRLGRVKYAGKILAAALFLFISVGGVIEIFRIHNTTDFDVSFGSGPLYAWLETETRPGDIFLSNTYVHHPILLSGRRIFYGWTYFGWSMGYPTGKKDELINKMFSETNLDELLRQLHENNIRYVAIDDGLRSGHMGSKLNERVFQANFERAYSDPEGKYGRLVIYKVP